MKKPIYYTGYVNIDAPKEKVWDALINPALTPLYMYNCEPITDWQIGSPLVWRGKIDGTEYVTGKVLRFEPGKMLSFTTFNPMGDFPDVPENHLVTSYAIKPIKEGGVELTVSQGDFAAVADGVNRFKDADGWMTVLVAIKELVEEEIA
ncbi:MAG: SRPBCC domain-containing protein [Saprospiraceae bacterium]|nr:SRPBCC domain-containing protein [Saprospiraceae bacterium]